MMLAQRHMEATTARSGGSSLASLSDLRPDTVSPHDQDALEALFDTWTFQDQLSTLIRGAVQSRRLAEQHLCAARSLVEAARSAEPAEYRDHLASVRAARRRAHECSAYARQCENRANTIAMASGFHPGPAR
ncbi:MAG: hypothetical protein IPM60_10900 [Rhodospirillales bacterium]|nr:hypothetical protein [Rhodospirillales bacterium]